MEDGKGTPGILSVPHPRPLYADVPPLYGLVSFYEQTRSERLQLSHVGAVSISTTSLDAVPHQLNGYYKPRHR